jgi:hypothetical protein
MEGEMGRPDDFGRSMDELSAAYVGKTYPDGETEVISMGLEMLYTDPIGFCAKDPEYAAFVINLVSSSEPHPAAGHSPKTKPGWFRRLFGGKPKSTFAEHPLQEPVKEPGQVKKSPPGGILISGQFFEAGQDIPEESYNRATPEAKAHIEAGRKPKERWEVSEDGGLSGNAYAYGDETKEQVLARIQALYPGKKMTMKGPYRMSILGPQPHIDDRYAVHKKPPVKEPGH